MRFTKTILLIFGLTLAACNTIAPTPILMKRAVVLNNEVNALYVNCSEGVNFVPELETCNVELLEEKTVDLRDLSKRLVSADINQPQGYDIYLTTTMIYFRIAERALKEYTIAERIARQFFEIQKASSGRSIKEARFYLVHYTEARVAYELRIEVFQRTSEEKVNMLFVISEGLEAIPRQEGPRKVRLKTAVINLQIVANLIP